MEDSIIRKQFFVRERFCNLVGHVREKIRQGCLQHWSDLVQEQRVVVVQQIMGGCSLKKKKKEIERTKLYIIYLKSLDPVSIIDHHFIENLKIY